MRFERFVFAAAAAALACGVQAQPKTVWKAADVHPAGYPTVVAVESLGKKMEKATHGRIGVQMYGTMQLGGEKEMIEQAQVGALQFARVSVGALGPVVDELNVFNLPYVFRNTAHMQKVVDGAVGKDLLDKITGSGKGLVGLCWMDAGARSLYSTKKPIQTIADLKGMKFRVMGNPIFVDMMNAMGGNGVPMGYDQVFNALQTGVIDGAENNPPSFVFDNHYQVAKYYLIDEHLIIPEVLLFCALQGRSGPPRQVQPRGAVRGAQALGRVREAGDGEGQGGRHQHRPGIGQGQEGDAGRGEARVGQVRA
jgi:tripartite ATP-independent transporter DctP family solute receptor